ncbi:MAG: hypothetical protein F9K44_04605 [Hyphomicrobiaceae bacterium]|nr:MAG: hypothetical protein F9K44_04605 [Hyphomicrobiaceae bacterium]
MNWTTQLLMEPDMQGPLRHARGRACWEISAGFLRAFFAAELRAWHGEEPLWKVFWGYGVLTSVGLALLYLLAMNDKRVGIQQVLLIVLAGYTIWILVAIWRCAEGSPWGTLARGLTVAWAVNTFLVLAFLQVDLFAAYIGR